MRFILVVNDNRGRDDLYKGIVKGIDEILDHMCAELKAVHDTDPDKGLMFSELVTIHGENMGFDLHGNVEARSDEVQHAFKTCSLLARLLMQRAGIDE